MTSALPPRPTMLRPWLLEALLLAVAAYLLVQWAHPLQNLAASPHAALRYTPTPSADMPTLRGAQWLETVGIELAALTLLGGVFLLLRHWRYPANTPWTQVALWPIFMLLGGLGVLWIDGFAATGPLSSRNGAVGARYMGLAQMQGLFLACTVVLLTARFGRQLLATGIRLSTHASQPGRRPWLLGGGMALLGLVVGVGHPKTPLLAGLPLHGLGLPHLSGEILRLAVVASLAWGFYRYGDLPASRKRWRRGVLACAALMAVSCAGLLATGDRGPLQVVALQLALVLLPSVGLAGANPRLAQPRAALTGLALAGALGLFWWGQTQLAPSISTTAAERAWARTAPEKAASSNYIQTRWLLDAATPPGAVVPQGFGLGKVPFCGAQPWLGLGPCTLTSGAPIQLPSDFPAIGLIATYGLWPTAALIGLLVLWLRLLAHSANAPPDSADSVDRLRAWLVSLLALSLGIQALLSVAGAMGWALLTGITLPLLGYGQASLVVVALATGLALTPKSIHFGAARRMT